MGWSSHHPTGLIYYAPQHCYRGYTLTSNSRGGYHANLFDMEGRLCHQWYSPDGIGYAQLMPYGNLLLRTGPAQDADGAQNIGGSSSAILELDWDGNVVWEYRDPMVHHDFERLPNGNTLVLLFERVSEELTAKIRGGMDNPENPDRIVLRRGEGDYPRRLGGVRVARRGPLVLGRGHHLPAGGPGRMDPRQFIESDPGRRPAGQLPPHQRRGHRR